MPRKHSAIRSCYLVSSLSTDVGPLRAALQNRGIRVSLADQLPPGVAIAEGIRDQIRDADFVIGVLGKVQFDANVFYEIGVAHGLDKRIILFATDTEQKLPFDIEHHYVVRSPLTNSIAIEFAIEQILNAPPLPNAKRRPSPPKERVKPLGERATKFLRRLNELPKSGSARRLEDLVNDLLNSCGVNVVTEAATKEIVADFAVWSDELDPILGNPLIVELKRTIRGTSDVTNAGQQLGRYLAQSGGLWGLLLYQNGIDPDHPAWVQLPPTVIAMRLDYLIRQLRTRSFTDVIRDRRNLLVHGIKS
jgi:hypothetical protein